MARELGLLGWDCNHLDFFGMKKIDTKIWGGSLNGGFPQQPWVFPTKMIILVVFWGYHHLRKHPYVKDITVLFAEFSEFQFCNVISYQRTEQRLLQAHAFISRLLHDDAWSGNHRAVVSASCSEVITAVQNRGCNPPFLSCTLHIHQKWHFEDDFPFPKVRYVNSLEGTSRSTLVFEEGNYVRVSRLDSLHIYMVMGEETFRHADAKPPCHRNAWWFSVLENYLGQKLQKDASQISRNHLLRHKEINGKSGNLCMISTVGPQNSSIHKYIPSTVCTIIHRHPKVCVSQETTRGQRRLYFRRSWQMGRLDQFIARFCAFVATCFSLTERYGWLPSNHQTWQREVLLRFYH